MHTEDTPGIFAVRAGFLAEACRVAGILDRQLLGWAVKPLVRVESRDRLLRRSNQVLVVFVTCHLVQLLVKLVKLGRFGHVLLAHHERRHDLLVFFLAQKVQSVVNQCLIQVYAIAC